jgi:hypothetical protein
LCFFAFVIVLLLYLYLETRIEDAEWYYILTNRLWIVLTLKKDSELWQEKAETFEP